MQNFGDCVLQDDERKLARALFCCVPSVVLSPSARVHFARENAGTVNARACFSCYILSYTFL